MYSQNQSVNPIYSQTPNYKSYSSKINDLNNNYTETAPNYSGGIYQEDKYRKFHSQQQMK